MAAGKMRERVTLQARPSVPTTNEYNEPDPNVWDTLLVEVPADVYALAGREFVAAQQTQASVTHRVMLRTPTELIITQSNRFVWTERLISGVSAVHHLDIKQVVPLRNPRGYTECLCTEHIGA